MNNTDLSTKVVDSLTNYLEEGFVRRTICIFPGRFQPFGPHHFEVWRELAEKFGVNNVFIATSNVVNDETSPLNFSEKKQIIASYNIRNVELVKNPYQAIEITEQFVGQNTAVVFAYGEKDFGRLRFEKIDGTPGYFRKYEDGDNLRPLTECGYAYLVKNQMEEGKISNSTDLRKYLTTATLEDFKQKYPKLIEVFDNFGTRKIFETYSKFFKKKVTMKEIFENIVKSDGKGKHLQHPWEDETLTYSDLRQLINYALNGNLQYVSEKVDGQNCMVTFRNGEFLFARNKTQIQNPVSLEELIVNFQPSVRDAFRTICSKLVFELQKLDLYMLSQIFRGRRFLNFEVIHPLSKNVIDYGEEMAVFHSINEYDDYANEIGRYLQLPQDLISNLKNPQLKILKNQIKLNPISNPEHQYKLHTGELNSIWKKYGLNMSQSLGDLYKVINPTLNSVPSKKKREDILRTECYPVIENLFISLGVQVLKNVKGFVCQDPEHCMSEIRREFRNVQNGIGYAGKEKYRKFIIQNQRIQSAGGLENLAPLEGIVFTFNGKLYKFTGLFAPINQILGIFKYSR